MNVPIRILVADDHPIVRDGLVAILSTQADFVVVGEASNGEELIAKAVALQPTVVLADLEMPQLDGAAAIQRLSVSQPDLPVIVLTAFDTDDRIIGALQSGARGYLLKGAPRNEIFQAIRVVSAGGSLLHPPVAARVLQHLNTASLTPREQEVLLLVAQGQINKEIAAMLNISERTVKFHVSAIMAKLGAGNRTEAVAIATQRGLLGGR